MPIAQLEKGNLFYEDYGKGVALIFIHPPGMGRKVFRYQKELSRNYRVILPDLSGHGDSETSQESVTIPGFADEVLRLIDLLGIEKVVLCGYSSGGSIAQEFALRYPERTAAIILSGGFAKVESPASKYEHLLGIYFVKHFRKNLAKVIATAHTFEKGFRDELITHMLKTDPRTWFLFYHQSLKYSCLDRLKYLSVPLLLIYGSRDFINQHIRAYKREVPDYEIAIVHKVSHQVPVKKWQDFNQAITVFLEKHNFAES